MMYSVFFVAALLCAADAHPTRTLLQQGGAASTLPMQAQQVQVEAPAQETSMINSFLLMFTPAPEIMDLSTNLQGLLSTPDQLSGRLTTDLMSPNGLAVVSAAFSDLISKGQSQSLVNALRQLPAMQAGGVSAQIGGAPVLADLNTQVATAFSLAVIDQVARGDLQNAGEAIWWGLSGGQQVAASLVQQLDALQARIGCSSPLRDALNNAGIFAVAQQQGGGMNKLSTFVSWMQTSPSLWACFQNSSGVAPQLIMMAQPQAENVASGGMRGAATTTTGMGGAYGR